MSKRVGWGLAVALAVVVLGGLGRLGSWLRSYWIARYRGEKADLHGAILIHAPLAAVQFGRCEPAARPTRRGEP